MNIDGPSSSIIVWRESQYPEKKSSSEHETVDLAYHQLRERTERRAAKEAASVQSRRIHQELAKAHSEMAVQCGRTWGR